jgi:hypothetical protein
MLKYIKTVSVPHLNKNKLSLSRDDNTSKTHLVAAHYDLSIEFIITGDDVHNSKAANELIEL